MVNSDRPSYPWPAEEYRFDIKRRWRFDFAWPEQKVAVEIEGGLYKVGRHQSLTGFLADAEKYEAALRLGWTCVPRAWAVGDGGPPLHLARGGHGDAEGVAEMG